MLVSSYQTGYSTGQDEAYDSCSMSYAKLEWTYKAQKPDGSLEAGLDFKYDLKQQQASLILEMTAKQLFQAGKLNEAMKALAAEVRDNPTDPRRRTFLFELLCFAGEYDRAEKHLHVLAQGNSQVGDGRGVVLLRACTRSEPVSTSLRTKPFRHWRRRGSSPAH